MVEGRGGRKVKVGLGGRERKGIRGREERRQDGRGEARQVSQPLDVIGQEVASNSAGPACGRIELNMQNPRTPSLSLPLQPPACVFTSTARNRNQEVVGKFGKVFRHFCTPFEAEFRVNF